MAILHTPTDIPQTEYRPADPRWRAHARPMTATQSPRPSTVPGFVVLDLDVPDRQPLAEVGDYEAGLRSVAVVQEEFHDQLDANGAGGGRVEQRQAGSGACSAATGKDRTTSRAFGSVLRAMRSKVASSGGAGRKRLTTRHGWVSPPLSAVQGV